MLSKISRKSCHRGRRCDRDMSLGASHLFQKKNNSSFPSIPCFRLHIVACNSSSSGFFCPLPPSVGSSPHSKQTYTHTHIYKIKIICFCMFYFLIKNFIQHIWPCFLTLPKSYPPPYHPFFLFFKTKLRNKTKKNKSKKQTNKKNTTKTKIKTNRQKTKKAKKWQNNAIRTKKNHRINFMLAIYSWTWVLPWNLINT